MRHLLSVCVVCEQDDRKKVTDRFLRNCEHNGDCDKTFFRIPPICTLKSSLILSRVYTYLLFDLEVSVYARYPIMRWEYFYTRPTASRTRSHRFGGFFVVRRASYYIRQARDVVPLCVCSFVCLYVRQQDSSRSCGLILMNSLKGWDARIATAD